MHRAYALCLWPPVPQSGWACTAGAGKAPGAPASPLSFFPERERGRQPPNPHPTAGTGILQYLLGPAPGSERQDGGRARGDHCLCRGWDHSSWNRRPLTHAGLPPGSIGCTLLVCLGFSHLCPFLSFVFVSASARVRWLLVGAIINNHNYCLGPTSETTFFLRHPQPGPPEACRIFFLSVLTRAFLRRCLCSDACLLPALDHGVAVPLTGVGLDSAIYWPRDITSPRHSCGVMSARGGGPRELTVGG